ncbi:MAG: UvrD-helicase domain-containing protein [Metallibacterium sp.]
MHRSDAPIDATPQALDWMRLPLRAPRRVLIEASAGTGKTYTLTLLYLRLLLEAPDDAAADVRGVLVSTFTEAAAAELRLRLRARLGAAEQLLQAHCAAALTLASDEPADSLARYVRDHLPLEPQAALLRVRRARQDMDLAPILTLHGFCARVLAELAFDGHGDLTPGEHIDEHELLDECLRDFWRQRYQRAEVDADELALVVPGGPDGLRDELREYFALSAPHRYGGGRAALAALLPALLTPARVAELGVLANDATRYKRKGSRLGNRLAALHACARNPGVGSADLQPLVKEFDDALVADGQNPKAAPLSDEPLVKDWLRVAALLREWPAIVRGEVLAAAIAFCRAAMAQRLLERGGFTFGALIERVHARVVDDANFAQRLFERYPCALIDEFQDTDQHQYAIFDALYRARGTLLLVGDPKQAIYAFRGGDIATYRRAERGVDARVSLAVNWRSTRAYIDALNGLYAHTDGDAMGAGIAYRAVQAGGKADAQALMRAGARARAPLILRLPRPDQEPPRTLADADDFALRACAADIARLLASGEATLGARSVDPGDIAVLLPTHRQIAALRQHLAARGVPAAGAGKTSVFDTAQADDLALILRGLLEGSAAALRAAWLTDLWGLDAVALRALDADTAALQAQLVRSAELTQHWLRQGPLALLMSLIEHAASRLLTRQDGERALTDLRHLGELLQAQAAAGFPAHAQLAWLRRQQADADGSMDEHQQRIDSDRARVQLRTLASAKGLQWPLVFLPLAWRAEGVSRKPHLLRFHDAGDHLSVDLGSPARATHQQLARREAQEERARLLYVALTRAQQACWVYWIGMAGKNTHAQTPLAALLERASADAPGAALDDRLHALPCRVPQIAVDDAALDHDASYRPAAAAAGERARAAQTPPSAAQPWQQWSFTALTRHATGEPRAAADEGDDVDPNLDAEAWPEAAAHVELEALQSLRGPAFGDAVHAMFEHAAPGVPMTQQQMLITRALTDSGVQLPASEAAPLRACLAARIDACMRADLGDGLCLQALAADAQIAEMEFLLPLAAVPLPALRALLHRHGAAALVPEALGHGTLRGMLGGYIDKIVCWQGRYHVIDYKTNWLGARVDDYQGVALAAAMRDHHYPLQALLYTLALHRLLRQRLRGYDYARHMGAALYLFVRALDLAPQAGVWRHRFDAALVQALDELCDGARA